MKKLTHIDENGNAVMVDVSEKAVTSRTATAEGKIFVGGEVLTMIREGSAAKGDVLAAARIAGIMACKKTSDIIPLCHPLFITNASVDLDILEDEKAVKAVCTVRTEGKTGVEMEALTGVSAALLTVYDMCKAVSKSMVISDIHLVEKAGGRSGYFLFGKEGARL